MSTSYNDYVNVLTDDEFESLIESINRRIDKEKCKHKTKIPPLLINPYLTYA